MVADKKKILVKQLTQQIKDHNVIAVVNMENLPARQLQNMRAQLLKKEVLIVMARKRLLQLALKNSQKENITALIDKIKGMPALLLSNENPFILYKILEKNKSSAPAKAGQMAPKDIIVPAGPTNFAPGPIISELANVGIKSKVDGGKLTIVKDAVVAKEGDAISVNLAGMLKRLDIQPMEIGLDLVAAWEDKVVFDSKQLHVDEEEYLNNIGLAFQEALNLSMEISYPTKDNIELLLQKAFQESKALSIEENILTDLTTDEILAKTERAALSLKEAANIKVSTEPKPKEEKSVEKKEEKVEEAPVKEEKKEEKVEETPVEETPVEETPVEETPVEETPVEKPEEAPVEEENKVEETPVEKPQESPELTLQPEPTPEPIPTPESQPESDIPSAMDIIEATKKQFAPEGKSKVMKNKTSAENIIKASTEVPSAIDLVQEEKVRAEAEKPKRDPNVEAGENLFEKLKKQGTLREEQ